MVDRQLLKKLRKFHFAAVGSISANIATSMTTSREKKRLRLRDWFLVVLMIVVWIATAYHVAIAGGLPAGLFKSSNVVLCLLVIPLTIWRTVSR